MAEMVIVGFWLLLLVIVGGIADLVEEFFSED